MHRRRITTLLLLSTITVATGHEEWNRVHVIYSAGRQFTYPFDGRTPKIATALLNHYPTASPAIVYRLDINGQPASGFVTFPDGGPIVAPADDFGLAAVLTNGIYDGRAGIPPVVGESKDFTFRFVFALAPGESPPAGSVTSTNPDPENNNDPPGITTAKVTFINAGNNPVLSGPLACAGVLQLPAGADPAANARVEVATPYSNWFPLTLVPVSAGGGTAYSFSQALPARHDWHVRFSADGCETRVLPFGFINDPHPAFDVTLAPAATLDLDYRRIAAVATPTGFWRGAVSESEGTFAAFPGQENWPQAATDEDRRALRSAARVYKYRFDGTRLWEHAPGWETWGGDMTLDGRYVAYALNPTAQSFYTPSEHKLVLLDGTTGSVLWTRASPPADPAIGRKLDSHEVVFSPDARWIAVGSTGSGTVTLVDRATGNFAWTIPGPGTRSLSQVRKLRFSPDSRFLFVGSGDGHLRKLQVSDGAILWRTFVGSWPFVNGLDLTPDGAWLAVGTRSLDAAVVRASDGRLQWKSETQNADAVTAPDGRHLATAGGQIYRLVDGSLAGMTKSSAPTRFTPDGRHAVQLSRDLRLFDLGGKLLKTFESSGLGTGATEVPQWAHLTRDGRHAIILGRDLASPMQTGIVIYERRVAGAAASAPAINFPPLSQTITIGSTTTLATEASGAAPLSYQWRKDGVPIPNAGGAALVIANASAADAGTYTCVVANAAGAVTAPAATLNVVPPDAANPARIANLSVRAGVAAGAPLIVGFAVGGSNVISAKPLLVRGAGPSLRNLQVDDALANPRLTLFDRQNPVLTNEDWGGEAQVTALSNQVGAFPFTAASSRDAAFAATAVNGNYTVHLATADQTGGTALTEIYDGSPAFSATTTRLINVSARTDVSPGNVLIAGFVLAGPAARTVLIRGIGPALAQFSVTTALADPRITLYRDTSPLAANDNWHDASNAVAIAAAAAQVGAFSLPSGSRDAALLLSLPPGGYTVHVSSAAAAAGNALVEIYDVP